LDYSLVSIGLVSFVVIAQLAPAFFGALFWKRGSKKVLTGIILGFCCLHLITPLCFGIFFFNTFIQEGPWGLELLRPLHLLD
jgi:Na+/proline symporter